MTGTIEQNEESKESSALTASNEEHSPAPESVEKARIPISRAKVLRILAIIVTLFSVARIYASYHQLSSTIDEPYFLGTGMQLLDQGEYIYPSIHPPLASFAAVILPYLNGERTENGDSPGAEGVGILGGGTHYWETLTFARIGSLLFYIVGVFLLWLWSKELFGDEIAFLTVLCYTLIPPVLAHAGLATSDSPFTTTFFASCYTLWWWVKKPSLKNGVVLGIVLGISACTKLTFLLFFPV